MIRRRSIMLSVPPLLLAVSGLFAVAPSAGACTPLDCAPSGGVKGGSGSSDSSSSGTATATYAGGSGLSCSVYANGGGMGSYCFSPGGSDLQTLRERFGGQTFQACRYVKLPDGIEPPFNENPDQGTYMLRECIGNVDFDTYSGGKSKTLQISVVFVPNGTDLSIDKSKLTEFLWTRIQQDAQLPVPFMRPRPSLTPIVGVPTFFTFNWLDPVTKQPVKEGPFADKEGGGPYLQINNNGLVMRAIAAKIEIDPKQKGIDPITCTPDTPYTEGAAPNAQPKDACSIVFPRSSASARQYSTETIPESVGDAYYATVRVYWKIAYGEDENHLQPLGGGFVMRVQQAIPVQEVQVPNQPPAVVF